MPPLYSSIRQNHDLPSGVLWALKLATDANFSPCLRYVWSKRSNSVFAKILLLFKLKGIVRLDRPR